jgi:F-type H+-transporting ATPase subunit alpha
LYRFVENADRDLLDEIRTKRALDKDLEAKIRKTIEEFKPRFVAENAGVVKAHA